MSFYIACPANLFEILSDVTKWPSGCCIREFKLEMKVPLGVELHESSPAKNEAAPHAIQTPQQQLTMETA